MTQLHQGRAPEERFSDRVANYVRYRPGYPAAIIEVLRSQCGLTPSWCVADIGSGTGLLSQLFLHHGNQVFGVEPNPQMRAGGESLLRQHANFVSCSGSAEQTGLGTGSVELIVAGQAFHWFDRERTRPEFARLLVPDGWVALIWNQRRNDTPFMSHYETVLGDSCPEYAQVNHRNFDPGNLDFFAPGSMRAASCKNQQRLDWEGLLGRVLSSSYAPTPEDPRHQRLRQALRRAFEIHQVAGQVQLEYDCHVYYGHL